MNQNSQQTYAVELYAPRFAAGAALDAEARIDRAAAEMRREGTAIRYLRSVFLRGDEICFLLVEAASADDVTEAARRAAIGFERVLEVDLTDQPRSERTDPKGSEANDQQARNRNARNN